MEIARLLSSPLSSSSSAISPQSQPLLPSPKYSFFPPISVNVSPSPHLLRRFHAKSRRWDSNAETVRRRSFTFNFGDSDAGEDDADDDDGVRSGMDKGSSGFWEEVLNEFWILKVFRSYGWLLPVIIITLLLTTGPKAFLMALAVPLGQSAICLVFKKLWGMAKSRLMPKDTTKKKPSSATAASSNAASNFKTQEGEGRGREQSRKRKMGYESWVDRTNGSVNRDDRSAPNFGGWEELDEPREFGNRMESWEVGGGRRTRGVSQRKSVKKGSKVSMGGRKVETPLLLRLLIAVFPFLGSWSRML
ncbi:uncharacterized protein LOC131152293 [Malania oleifera]|uniref:uncharacterized protein LOC131152293 n=1 Tax=Malania oleifera TaxID=397392 RepID=UPI0025AE8A2F|nr:uncharacterized protein LOC131152293 [Malania oleifera]